jgi:hypothetical protein
MPFPHITDTLAAAGVLEDDRPDTLAVWLDTQLAGMPAQIRAELDTWLGLLRHGGPRRRPRSLRVYSYAAPHAFFADQRASSSAAMMAFRGYTAERGKS